MGAVATFNYAAWVARYPEFSAVTEPVATAYWDEAGLLHANDGSGPVGTVAAQAALLGMVTAHLAMIYSGAGGAPASPLVGRISNASEGSVSVQTEYAPPSQSAAYWNQTKYGAQYWAATAVYRTAHYRPGPRRVFDRFGFWR